MMRVAKRIEFDAGHRIQDHASQCRRLHGHRYVVEAEVEGELQTDGSSRGMVLDFAELKKALMAVHDEFDHRCILEGTDPLCETLQAAGEPFIPVTYPPTAENIAAECAVFVQARLHPFTVTRITVWETPTSSATWTP